MWYVYILLCSDKTFYTGITNDIDKRVAKHNLGKASLYTRGRTPVKLIYLEELASRSLASKREYIIKKLKREEKEKIINYKN